MLQWMLSGGRSVTQPWPPHAATIVIGLAFVTLLLLAGARACTDVLADLARGKAGSLPARGLLALALLAGALTGGALTCGALTGKLRCTPAWRDVLRCLTGGLLMGWGSLLVPGGNDGLVLLGMPLLWPCAWASFGPMCAAVAVGLGVSSRLRRDARRRDARYGSSKLNVTVPLIAAAASKLRSLTCTTRRPACRSTTTSVEQRVP